MDPRRYQQVKAILGEALDLPATERSAFLLKSCGDDASLRAEVESLLAYEAQEDFLQPIVPSLASEDHNEPAVEAETSEFDPLVGRTFSHYRLTKRLGGGGMGVVYLGQDTRLGRRAALKFIKPQFLFDEAAEARFEREARAIAALDHPNICTLYGIERTEDGRIFLAMAYYEGQTLRDILDRGPLPLNACIDIGRQVANGLSAAHAAGIIHRDVKPGNIMVNDGFVKILDFGIAKLADQGGLTIPGMRLGTEAYASPEQITGLAVDRRTDIWSLGVVMYELATGQLPFDADPLPAGSLPEDFERSVRRALVTNPDDRYQTMKEFAVALESCRSENDRPIVSVGAAAGQAAEYAKRVETCISKFENARPAEREQFAAEARDALTKALTLDSTDPSVQIAAAELAFRVDWLPLEAQQQLERVLADQPDDPRAGLLLAECLVTTGNAAEARRLAADAVKRDPSSPDRLVHAGRILHFAKDYDQSARTFERALNLQPGSCVGRLDLALTLAKCGQPERACLECDRAASAGASAIIVAVLGNAARARGNAQMHDSARQLLVELQGRGAADEHCFELLDASFGDTGRSLEYLEIYDEHAGLAKFLGLAPVNGSLARFVNRFGLVVYLGIDPAFDCLHCATSVQSLLERLNRHFT